MGCYAPHMGDRDLAAVAATAVAVRLQQYDVSPSALATECDLDRAHLTAVFHDGTEELTPAELIVVAGALGVHPADFLIGAS